MPRKKPKPASNETSLVRALPMPVGVWDELAASLKFSPQQKRIVACVLRGLQDKQIAAEMGLSVPTIRTYLGRIFLKVGVADRMELVLLLFASVQDMGGSPERRRA